MCDSILPTDWQQQAVPVKKKLSAHGSEIAKDAIEAFEELCRKGCCWKELGNLVCLLSMEKMTIEIPSKLKESPERLSDGTLEIDPHALDSTTARGEFDTRMLEAIAKKAKGLLEDIRKLKQTELVKDLNARRIIQPSDLLSIHPIYDSLDEPHNREFYGLLHLSELAEQVGSQKKPHYTNQRERLHLYVREKTGEWCDSQIANILRGLSPDGDPKGKYNEDNLKAWRSRHNLTDPTNKSASEPSSVSTG